MDSNKMRGGEDMKMIQSFSVDHTKIVPGMFVSRVDYVGDSAVTTYDIRLKRPNREPVIDVAAMHTLEHIIATYLRNNPVWSIVASTYNISCTSSRNSHIHVIIKRIDITVSYQFRARL